MTHRTIIANIEKLRVEMPNLEGWTDDEILGQLPDQDPRYEQGEDGLRDLLGDIEYRD